VTVDLHEEVCKQIPTGIQSEVIQITREILSNIARHAAASEVAIRCAGDGDVVQLSIEDNGVGFDPSSVVRGFGLTNMEERAKRIGGTIEIRARQPKGTHHLLRIRTHGVTPESHG
jgi:signal transduction histidine kinase